MPQADALPWWRRLLGAAARGRATLPVATADDDAPTAPPLDRWRTPEGAIAFGQRIILFGIGSFFAWAVLAPLDEGVPAGGVVAVESQRKTISHATGGVVATIAVRENQRVAAGDVLLSLESVHARAAFDTAVNDFVAMAARLARLEAEQADAMAISYPAELKPWLEQPWARDLLQAQEQLFRARRQTLDGEQAILRETLVASQHQAQGARQQMEARQRQASLLRQDIGGMRELVEEGYAPRARLLEQERILADIAAATSEAQANAARGTSSGAEIRLRILQRRQEFLREVEAQIAEARREVANLRSRMKTAAEDLDRTVVRAPVSGQVIALQPHTIGAAIAPGARLLEIVPEGDALLLDVHVAPHLVSRIRAGLETDVRLPAFPEDPQLVITGKVESVSADRHVDPVSGQPYYLARVTVTADGQARLGARRLQPGMPVEVVIRTGERSFLTYLLHPFLQRMFSSFREV